MEDSVVLLSGICAVILKITKAPCTRRIGVAPRAEILVIRLEQITKFSVKVVNLETIMDMQPWWDVVSVQKNENFSGITQELATVLGVRLDA